MSVDAQIFLGSEDGLERVTVKMERMFARIIVIEYDLDNIIAV